MAKLTPYDPNKISTLLEESLKEIENMRTLYNWHLSQEEKSEGNFFTLASGHTATIRNLMDQLDNAIYGKQE